jgi:hypothetical protein
VPLYSTQRTAAIFTLGSPSSMCSAAVELLELFLDLLQRPIGSFLGSPGA